MNDRFHQVTAHRIQSMGITAMELTSNRSFPRHTHDEYGIGVMLSGGQRSWSGVGQVEAFQGDVITVNPGELHDGHPIGNGIRRWRIIYFDPKVLARLFVPELTRETEFISPSLREPRIAARVNVLFARLSNGADQLGVEEIVTHLVLRLQSPNIRPMRACINLSAPVAKARARIEEDPASPITLSDLSALSGVSRYQIVRAFARDVGTTPYAYVIQCRVRLARKMLINGETLAGAAQRAGFSDQSHMTRAFARQFGISPGRYRAAAN
jgi:AraC-like DNA-binding protein